MKFYLLLLLFVLFSGFVSAQKGIGLEGRIFSAENNAPVPGQKVFVVFESSAQPYVQNLHNELITSSNGSFSLSAPNIPNAIIPLDVMVYTYDCDFQRKGYLLTFNYNNVIGEDVNISVCTGSIQLPADMMVSQPADNTCPSFARIYASDSLKRSYLHESYQWTINDIYQGSGNSIDAFFTNEQNIVKLTQTFTDSITGFVVDSIQLHENFDIPAAASYILGGNVLLDGNNTTYGTAVLLGRSNNDYFIIDTASYQQYGYYYFTALPRCNYSVRIIESDGNLHSNSVPTYLGSVLQWETASYLNLTSDDYCANITLPAQQTGTGIGEISGIINSDDPSGYDALLYSNNMTPYSFRHCGTDGYFSFSGIPFGSFILVSEKYGVSSISQSITLSASNPSAFITFSPTTQMNEQEAIVFSVFPNPADDYIILSNKPESEIHIYTIEGKEIMMVPSMDKTIDIRQLRAGMYFLQTMLDGQIATIQFVVSR